MHMLQAKHNLSVFTLLLLSTAETCGARKGPIAAPRAVPPASLKASVPPPLSTTKVQVPAVSGQPEVIKYQEPVVSKEEIPKQEQEKQNNVTKEPNTSETDADAEGTKQKTKKRSWRQQLKFWKKSNKTKKPKISGSDYEYKDEDED